MPEERYAVGLGRARVVREGSDVTVVALGAMVPQALRAAANSRPRDDVEVLDPRTLAPLDVDTIAASVAKTERARGRARGGASAASAPRSRHTGRALLLGPRRADPSRRRGFAPVPYGKELELSALPGAAEIAAAVRSLAAG